MFRFPIQWMMFFVWIGHIPLYIKHFHNQETLYFAVSCFLQTDLLYHVSIL